MHGPFDKSSRSGPNIYQNWNIKLFALPLLLAIALIAYFASHPHVARWIADGVQAEFVGSEFAPDGPLPTRLAHH